MQTISVLSAVWGSGPGDVWTVGDYGTIRHWSAGDRAWSVAPSPTTEDLRAVQRRREFPVRMTQRMQVVVQNNIVTAALKPGNQPLKVPLVLRLVTAVPWLQGITARFVGLGVRPEHVHSASNV